MSNKIKAEDLQNAVMKALTEYREDIEDDVKEATDSIVKEAKEELKKTSPRRGIARKNQYYLGWAIKNGTKSSNKYTRVVWNKTNYQLTHLLEFGHATRNGGRTKAIPHIRPIEEKYGVKFEDKLKQKIRRNSK